MKKWCLIQSGSKIYLRFLDPEKEGALAYLNPSKTSYIIEGCKDILQSANEVVLERNFKKLSNFFMNNYPQVRLVA